jgi:glycosyltransferase involved in cell wall biosynthesis
MINDISITIITATLNSADHLQTCINSVFSQSFKNIEYIIVDGGSTDSTISIIKRNRKLISKFYTSKDKGIYEALNKGISLATSDIIGFLHSDDFLADKNVLFNIAKAFSNDSSISAVYGDLIYVSKNKEENIIRRWESSEFTIEKLYRGWMPPHPTLYIKKEWYIKIGGFDENYKISGDYLSILKLFQEQDFKSKYISKTLVIMRTGGISNRSLEKIILKSYEDWRALRICGFSIKSTIKILFLKNFSKIVQFTKYSS